VLKAKKETKEILVQEVATSYFKSEFINLGPKGETGEPGERGKSKSQFFSIFFKGTRGIQGEQGIQGNNFH
jgi:hypothetical protein